MTVLICTTCPRYVARASGSFGRAFTAALRDATDSCAITEGHATTIRNVRCLGGCPDDGVAALDAPGKARVRFTGLIAEDAAILLVAAGSYDRSDSGHPDDWPVPEQLQHRLSSITIKRLATEWDSRDHLSPPNAQR